MRLYVVSDRLCWQPTGGITLHRRISFPVGKVEFVEYFYWARGMSEVDFVIKNGSNVIPVEVKAEVNL